MSDFSTDRRDLLLTSLLAAAAASFGTGPAEAAGVDPTKTIITPASQIPWQIHYGYPADVAQEAALVSALDQPGQYLTLIRWYPGHMSAPHFYDFDRLCIVLSGTWYVASGEDFNPAATVPVRTGSFVRRLAKTVHYDGVISGVTEPAVIAITGMGPTKAHRIEPDKPGWRHV
jgi:hypothetical protein